METPRVETSSRWPEGATAQFASTVTLYTDPGCDTPFALGTSDDLDSHGIFVPMPDNRTIDLYATDSVAGVTLACSGPLTYVESSPAAAPRRFKLNAAIRRCRKKFHVTKRHARAVRGQ